MSDPVVLSEIYDPFLGSGTTLIAAETTGRVCHAVDIDPRYVDVAIQRWQRIPGKVKPPRPARRQ
ncbi:DNA methyltransferase [Roseomonas sp. CECT 9278]|uniref:DNA methyltransferase n=1 Tax=Roseomonas sp. CECT 9278 TaxID=2845823 RepID=UPI001E28A156|nr:DNA methyltransferase [Roseomonas sp. CECT 9278]CAH0130187.1 hypothetical protein ROS9278_00218 [Roseomonas sp. CECT 9278]